MKYMSLRVLVPVDKISTTAKVITETESYRWGDMYISDDKFEVVDLEFEVEGLPEGWEVVDYDTDEMEELHLKRYRDAL